MTYKIQIDLKNGLFQVLGPENTESEEIKKVFEIKLAKLIEMLKSKADPNDYSCNDEILSIPAFYEEIPENRWILESKKIKLETLEIIKKHFPKI
jgi:hypothetical protein